MPNIGPMELVIVAIIALLVLGPKRLPEAGRSLGKGMREFKNSISGGSSNDDLTAEHLTEDVEDVREPKATAVS